MEFDSSANQSAFQNMGGYGHYRDRSNAATEPSDFDTDMTMFTEPLSSMPQFHNNYSFPLNDHGGRYQMHQPNDDYQDMNLESDGTIKHIRKHGLFTPPSMNEGDFAAELETLKPSVEARKQPDSLMADVSKTKNDGKQAKQPSKSSSSTTRTRASKKGSICTRKARKGYKATTKEEEDDPEGDDKRQKFLERNRVAASKCRDKKKAWTEVQEGKLRALQTNNKVLRAQYVELQRELVLLKEAALPHFDCSTTIQQYLVGSVGHGNSATFAMNAPPDEGSDSQARFDQVDMADFFASPLQNQSASQPAPDQVVSNSRALSVRSGTPSMHSANGSIDPRLSSVEDEKESTDLRFLLEAELGASVPTTPQSKKV